MNGVGEAVKGPVGEEEKALPMHSAGGVDPATMAVK